jgi:hypothetical protein
VRIVLRQAIVLAAQLTRQNSESGNGEDCSWGKTTARE